MRDLIIVNCGGRLQTKSHATPDLMSKNGFRRAVLEIIAELSPCSFSRLFTAAALRGLQRFGDGSLDTLRELLGQCLRELQARQLVEIDEDRLVIAPTVSPEGQEIIDRTAELGQRAPKPEQASTNQKGVDLNYAGAEPRIPTPAQVTDRTERTPELPKEDTRAGPTSAEDADILDLTAQLELLPDELGDASTDQDHVGDEPNTETEAMHGDHALEPTREEIIAAMRKFFSQDKRN